jgi:methylation protein EvaC
MRRLAERAGLFLVDVVKTPIHGTSYVFVLAKQPAKRYHVENILAMESHLHDPATYANWAAGVNKLLVTLKSQIDDYRNLGYTIIGYGAAAKGMTLINASDIPLHCVIDDNPLKQGLYCPGTSIPIVGIDYLDKLLDDERVIFIPLAWNFYNEIKSKIQRRRAGQKDYFLRYFPEIKVE